MQLPELFSEFIRRARMPSLRRRTPYRQLMGVEHLQDRILPAVFTVTNLNDGPVANAGDMPGTLRQALFDANNNGEPDDIRFAAGLTGTITLVGGQLSVSSPLIIDGANRVTIDAAQNSRILGVDDGSNTEIVVRVSGLRLTGANGDDGGAIFSRENLTVVNSTFDGNSANSGAGVYVDIGSALIVNSTFSANTVSNFGGGIFNFGNLTIVGTTFVGNSADNSGGGIANLADASVYSSTVAGNISNTGGGIFHAGNSMTAHNTIVAGNRRSTSGPLNDVQGFVSLNSGSSNNLVSDAGSAGGLATGQNGNIVGVDWTSVVENNGTTPILRINGGVTQTVSLLEGGPGIDAGDGTHLPPDWADLDSDNNVNEMLPLDQTGATRIVDVPGIANASDGLDIGAVEFSTNTNTLIGDVDGDSDFDANDTFLIQLIRLQGTNQQIDQSKGASLKTASQIRTSVEAISNSGDVDGDADFDSNDAFLTHLVKLQGTDVQINQSKGASPRSAAEIRHAVNSLGLISASTESTVAPIIADVQPSLSLERDFESADRLEADVLFLEYTEGATSHEFMSRDTYRQWLDAL